jgi:hypothetical protein
MSQVLMPKATAVWLIENTALTFDQISEFCGLHPLEVQSIADGEAAIGMVGYDPITNGQLTKEEIERCGDDPAARLALAEINVPRPKTRTKGPRYTPVARRQDRPDAIAWLVRNFPQLSDGQISKLVGTTKPTINGVRNRTHWNINNIKPRDPVALGLVTRDDLTAAIEKANRAFERAEKRKVKESKNYQPVEVPKASIEEQTPRDLKAMAKDKAIVEKDLTAEDVFGAAKPAQETMADEAVTKKKPPVTVPDDGNPFAALGQLIPQSKENGEEKTKNDTDDHRD